jgi:hypothetical protein
MKQILKRIFPVIFLKNLFLIFNKLKANTLDRLLFTEYFPLKEEILLLEEKNPFLEFGIDTSRFTNDVKEGFSRWSNPEWKQDQFIIQIKQKDVFIEGRTGWGIVERNKLIYFSLGFARAPHVHKPDIYKTFLRQRVEVRLPLVISLRDTGEENYFHFYNDIVPKLFLLQEFRYFNAEAYLLVSKRLWEKPYFQSFIDMAEMVKLKWYVQDKEWIRSNHVIFCKPYTHTKKYLDDIVNLTKSNKARGLERKIYLTRKAASLRYIENEREIYSILASYGFERIEAETLSLQDQIDIFRNTADLIAVHGAGLINMIFRRGASLRVLELFHWNDYLPFHYVMVAQIFGFQYDAVRGTSGSESRLGGFYIDPVKIKKYCENLNKE